MTSNELKATLSMREVLSRYGISVNRAGMCSCPFHGRDKHPSMKIYKDGYHCFTCGKNGDIFSFVQEMDSCDFKTAFLSLGGEYQNDKKDFFQQQKLKNAMKEREKRLKAEERRKAINNTLYNIKTEYGAKLKELEPFSDDWCIMQNDLVIINGWLESKIYEECEVDTSGVISRYKQFKQKRNNVG